MPTIASSASSFPSRAAPTSSRPSHPRPEDSLRPAGPQRRPRRPARSGHGPCSSPRRARRRTRGPCDRSPRRRRSNPRYGFPPRISPPPTPVPSVSMIMSSTPWPAPAFHSAIAAQFAVVVERHGKADVLVHPLPKIEVAERHVHRVDHHARALVDRRRQAESDSADAVIAKPGHDVVEQRQELVGLFRRRPLDPVQDPSRAVDDARGDLRAADIDPDSQVGHAATIVRPWPRERSPTASTAADASRGVCRRSGSPSGRRPAASARPRSSRGRGRASRRPSASATGGAGSGSGSRSSSYSSSSGGSAATSPCAAARTPRTRGSRSATRRRRPRSSAQSGLVLTNPSVTLLLGTDHSSKIRERSGFERSDSIMLLRTDPSKGRLNYLSIPRDLR